MPIKYVLTPELTFTIEPYMGPTISLKALTIQQAFAYGGEIGRFFRAMHTIPPHINGFGELIWNNRTIKGREYRNMSQIWQADMAAFYEQFDWLSQSAFRFDGVAIKSKLDYILDNRAINDVAYENLQRLMSDMNEEIYLRAGDIKTIAARLQICLNELEAHQLN